MMFSTRSALAALTLLSVMIVPLAARAQSLTTTYASDNGNNLGGGVFFDLNVFSPTGITIQSLETNVTGAGGAAISLEVWVRSGTALGFETDPTGWTLISSGTGVSAPVGSPSIVDIPDFFLGNGITGVAIRNVDYEADYTDGSNIYSNADLSLTTGSATNTFLAGGTVNSPRTWNGTINYTTTAAAPEPGSLALLAVGIGGMWARRRKQNL